MTIDRSKYIYTGDLVFFSGTSIYSKLIMKFTNSNVSHVGIVVSVDVEDNCVLIAEALNRGFVINSYTIDYLRENTTLMYVYKTLSKQRRNEIRSEILKHIGKGYDWLAIWQIATNILFDRPILWRSTRHLICSEAVALIYLNLGVDLVPNKVTDAITPDDIYSSDSTIIYG